MNNWHKTADELPTINEKVLILYKHKKDDNEADSFHYAIAYRYVDRYGYEEWNNFCLYTSNYEVVYWKNLDDIASVIKKQNRKK